MPLHGAVGSGEKNCAGYTASVGSHTLLLMIIACAVQWVYSYLLQLLDVRTQLWSWLASCDNVTLYQSVLAVEHDQRTNKYRDGRAVMKRYKFLLKHSHCKHYCSVHFTDQTEYILQRKTVLAMSLHLRLWTHSLFSRFDPHLIRMIV